MGSATLLPTGFPNTWGKFEHKSSIHDLKKKKQKKHTEEYYEIKTFLGKEKTLLHHLSLLMCSTFHSTDNWLSQWLKFNF